MSVYGPLERFYTIVYDQQFSPSGKYLATCDNFGQIAIFSLSSALSLATGTNGKTPIYLMKAHQGPAYSLTNADSLLVSGGTEDIRVWKWDKLTSSPKDIQPVLTLKPPAGKYGVLDTNGLAYDKQTSTLYSGCGDNKIYAWDLKKGQIKATYSGHSDYVHCVCMRNGTKQFISGAEDGTVRIWDPSSAKNPVHTLKAEGSGHWVGCVAVDSSGEWMVSGGSLPPCIYHLNSQNKVASLPVPKGVATQDAIFTKDRIITVGSEPLVRHWSVNGDAITAVPGSQDHAFSVTFNARAHQYEVLAVSGDSADIHVFTNFGYKALSLTVTVSPQQLQH